MPKSKRNKVVSLTKTGKKGLDRRVNLVDTVRKACDDYASIYLFSVNNMRNQKMKDVRQKWRTSRFFFGKNRVMALGLGKNKENEYKENLHKLSNYLSGDVGLMFTNETKENVVKWYNGYSEEDYARSGNKATQTITLPAGELDQNTFSHSMEPALRALGLPTSLVKGVVTLTDDFTVCKAGDTLTPTQCTILKHFSMPTVQFQVELKCVWHSSGVFEELNEEEMSD